MKFFIGLSITNHTILCFFLQGTVPAPSKPSVTLGTQIAQPAAQLAALPAAQPAAPPAAQPADFRPAATAAPGAAAALKYVFPNQPTFEAPAIDPEKMLYFYRPFEISFVGNPTKRSNAGSPHPRALRGRPGASRGENKGPVLHQLAGDGPDDAGAARLVS